MALQTLKFVCDDDGDDNGCVIVAVCAH